MESGDEILPVMKIKQEVIEKGEEEHRPSETEGYQIFFIAEDAIKEEDMTQDEVEEQWRQNDTEQNSLQDADVEMQVTTASSCQLGSMEGGDEILPVMKIKQEVIEEEEEENRPSETEGYQIFFIAEDAIKEEDMTQDEVEEHLRQNDTEQNSLQDVDEEMQVTTASSCQPVGNTSLQNTNRDLNGRLSEEDKGQDERKRQNGSRVGIPSFQSSSQDSNQPPSGENIAKDGMRGPTSERPIGRTRKQQVNTSQKKVFLAKNVNFIDNKHQRNQAKYRRAKNLFRKCRELSQVTECEVFLYVKDEFSKTTYWGTSDALQLFKPVLDSVITRGDKCVRSVRFVASLNPDECPLGAPSTDSDAQDSTEGLGKEIPERKPPNDIKRRRRKRKDKVTEKKVCFSKNLEFQDLGCLRNQARYRRCRNIFKKGHELAEVTKSEVFMYVKDEFRKVAYWGTSEALQLFQLKLDSLTTERLRAVQCVQFVIQSKAPKDVLCRSSTSKETVDCHDPYAVCRGSVSSNQESRLTATSGSPQGSPSLFLETTGHSAPESKPVIPYNSKSTSETQKSSGPKLPIRIAKTQKTKESSKPKKVCLAKNFEFNDNKHLRNQAKYRRGKCIFKKSHELAEVTKCQVFVYVRDEYSKTLYWGTSDALDLFQPTIDSLIIEKDTAAKLVQSVEFVTTSKACEELDSLEAARTLLNPKTGEMEVNAEPKKVCLKSLEFNENKHLRNQARYRRVKCLMRKVRELADVTKCQVFLYVKDEFSKTTYWGTSDALQLFQSTIDSLVKREKKPVQSVEFVTPSGASEVVESTSPTNSDAIDCGSQSSDHLESVPSSQKSVPIFTASGSFQDSAFIRNNPTSDETSGCKDPCARRLRSVQSCNESLPSSPNASSVGSSHDGLALAHSSDIMYCSANV